MNDVFAARAVGSGSTTVRRPSVVPVVTYTVGMVVGAVGLAVLLATLGEALGDLVGPVAVAVPAAALGLTGAAVERRGGVAPLPERRRQVPTRWLHWRRSVTGLAYGLVLGWSVWTLLHHASAYTVAACLLLVDPATAVAVGCTYGGVRAAMLARTWWAIPDLSRHTRWSTPDTREVAGLLPAVASLTILATAAVCLTLT